MTDISSNSEAQQALADEGSVSGVRPGDEMLPFLNNFHDIFTSMGVIILFVGLGLGASQLHGALNLDPSSLASELASIGLLLLVAVVAWGLSAILVGKQRRILPGILLNLIFVSTAGFVLIWFYSVFVVGQMDGFDLDDAFSGFEDLETLTRAGMNEVVSQLPWTVRIWPVALVLSFTASVMAFYANFRLPFAGGLAGLSWVTLAVTILLVVEPYYVVIYNPAISLITGLALFVAGVVFDARDPGRETRLAGTGFWLHFFAAPILLSSAITVALTGWSFDPEMMASNTMFSENGDAAMRSAIVTLTVIGAFALVSLLINRRALIVSGLITAGIAMGVMVSQLGLSGAGVVAVTLLLLGGLVVLLGVAWNPVRRILTAPFPNGGVLGRIIPPVRTGHEG